MAKKDLLKEYNRKRDFSITDEPSGKSPKKKGAKLSFVVQEHHASHLHWDFRLEMEGVLKSWAVPKGPSLDPSDKRLAMMTEDHPLEYGKFQGRIPEGEYGAGEVFLWDKGTWEPGVDDPVKALEKGKLEFVLKGKKLKGRWVLFRAKFKGNDRSWMLMKKRDEFAVSGDEQEEEQGLDPWPGFIEPQLPRLVEAAPEGERYLHELKFDGYRIQAHIKNGVATFFTRNANNWSNHFPFLLNSVGGLSVQSAILDGEVVALDSQGRPSFQGLQGSFKQKDDKHLMYYVFDLLYLNGEDLRGLPLLERKELLRGILKKAPKNIILSESFLEDPEDFFSVSCEQGLEGIISKQMDAPYRSGRSDLWTKTKCGQRQEFIIGGWTEPKGGRSGIGALMLGFYEGNELRYAGKVGTGFNQKTLKELRELLGPLEEDETPFTLNSPKKSKDVHWVTPDKVCEVSFSEWTQDKVLRAPVFQGLREDKPAPEIIQEKPKKKKTTKKAEKKIKGDLLIPISSPDKVLFSKEKITKLQVAKYYQAVGKYMLPYMQDRLLSLVRCPNGSEKGCFYQKHVGPGQFDHVESVTIEEEKGSEGIYLSVNSVEGLLELIQINAFELHAWGSPKDDHLHPDLIVMDLDPGPGVSWKQVVDAAFEMRELLEDLGLESFVKLTGGKGLHVCIPVLPLYDWDQIKTFAQGLATELVSRRPDFYTANMSKKLRNKKIFVDYLRNGFGATAVVPYSLRAKPNSAVAMPVDWKELKRIKGPQEFTLDKALKKVKSRKSDPWKKMLKLRQRIDILKPVAKGKKAA